jgi:hypothetical protein
MVLSRMTERSEVKWLAKQAAGGGTHSLINALC